MLPNILFCSYIKHKLEITNRFFLSHKGPVIMSRMGEATQREGGGGGGSSYTPKESKGGGES